MPRASKFFLEGHDSVLIQELTHKAAYGPVGDAVDAMWELYEYPYITSAGYNTIVQLIRLFREDHDEIFEMEDAIIVPQYSRPRRVVRKRSATKSN